MQSLEATTACWRYLPLVYLIQNLYLNLAGLIKWILQCVTVWAAFVFSINHLRKHHFQGWQLAWLVKIRDKRTLWAGKISVNIKIINLSGPRYFGYNEFHNLLKCYLALFPFSRYCYLGEKQYKVMKPKGLLVLSQYKRGRERRLEGVGASVMFNKYATVVF